MNPTPYLREASQFARVVGKTFQISKPLNANANAAFTSKQNESTPSSYIPVQPQYQQQAFPVGYQQTLMVPYGTPFIYTAVPYYQPVTYQPMYSYPFYQQPQRFGKQKRNFATATQSRKPEESFRPLMKNNAVPKNDNELYLEDDESNELKFDILMGVDDLYSNILANLQKYRNCRLSWFHRMLSKCQTAQDFNKGIQVLLKFHEYALETTSETATLFLKAACRCDMPELALSMLKKVDEYRLWPSISGIHYLMVNLSLKKKTEEVIEAFQILKSRQLKPNARTFHILIRECVDKDLIKEALLFANEARNEQVEPNRVTYNILMNGCRKHKMAQEILDLRSEMNAQNVEINDTTVKFTTLAHMMLGQKEEAVKAFMAYSDSSVPEERESFASKFFDATEDLELKGHVLELFQTLKSKGMKVPSAIQNNLESLEQELANKPSGEEQKQ